MYAFITSSAHLDFSGMQNVNPINMQMAVRAYLLPLLDAGWNFLIRSIAMNSMGWGGDEKYTTQLGNLLFHSNNFTRHYNQEILQIKILQIISLKIIKVKE